MKILFDEDTEFIQQSKNGVKYATARLATKKTVYCQAILEKIPHHDKNNDTICLKIGRYNMTGKPEIDTPRSELTLTDEELDNLIRFIEKFYEAMEMDLYSFIPVDSSQTGVLLKKFKSAISNDEEKAKLLIESGILDGNISIAIDHLKKEKELEELENNLDADFDEHFWQKWFNEHKWVLGLDYARILDDRLIDPNNIADYMVETNDGFLDLIEIKNPNSSDFWAATKDRDNYVPSSNLIKAITQCQNYLYAIETESNSAKFLERTGGVPIAKPRCLLVYGRSIEWNKEMFLAYRLLNASLNQIKVITYDQLLTRAKKAIGFSK